MSSIFRSSSASENVDQLLERKVHPVVWTLFPVWLFVRMFQEAAEEAVELHRQEWEADLILLSRYQRQSLLRRLLIQFRGQVPQVSPVCTKQDMLQYYAAKLCELANDLSASSWYERTAMSASHRCLLVAAYLA